MMTFAEENAESTRVELEGDVLSDERMMKMLDTVTSLERFKDCKLTWECPCERCNGK